MRVLVCGGREYGDRNHVFAMLDKLHAKHPVTLVVTGGQTGADTLGLQWAEARGIDRCAFPYNRDRGRAGGPHRNGLMLSYIRPEAVVAFPGDRGTANMLKQARDAEIERIWEVSPRSNATRGVAA